MATGQEHGKVGSPEEAGEVNDKNKNSFKFSNNFQTVSKNFSILFCREHMEVENSRIKRQLKYLKEMVVENEEVE